MRLHGVGWLSTPGKSTFRLLGETQHVSMNIAEKRHMYGRSPASSRPEAASPSSTSLPVKCHPSTSLCLGPRIPASDSSKLQSKWASYSTRRDSPLSCGRTSPKAPSIGWSSELRRRRTAQRIGLHLLGSDMSTKLEKQVVSVREARVRLLRAVLTHP